MSDSRRLILTLNDEALGAVAKACRLSGFTKADVFASALGVYLFLLEQLEDQDVELWLVDEKMNSRKEIKLPRK